MHALASLAAVASATICVIYVYASHPKHLHVCLCPRMTIYSMASFELVRPLFAVRAREKKKLCSHRESGSALGAYFARTLETFKVPFTVSEFAECDTNLWTQFPFRLLVGNECTHRGRYQSFFRWTIAITTKRKKYESIPDGRGDLVSNRLYERAPFMIAHTLSGIEFRWAQSAGLLSEMNNMLNDSGIGVLTSRPVASM